MPKRFDIDYVREYVAKKGCLLLSETYENSSTPLCIKCQCGNVFKKTFNKFKSGFTLCNECSKQQTSQKYRLSFDEVLKRIQNSGCEYIDGEYKNSNSILALRCSCGKVFKKRMSKFFSGQTRCTECGMKALAQSRTKYTKIEAQKILAKRGYVMVGEYVNAYTPVDCKCPNGHNVKIKIALFIYNQSGCRKCADNALKGDNHWNYKGGETELIDFFRKAIKSWKKDVARKYGYKCYLTGSKTDWVIHHLVSFADILHKSLDELGLPLHPKLKDYSDTELEQLKERVFSYHTVEIGVVLQRKVHNKFHALYGKGNNTIDQFNEFIQRFYPDIPTISSEIT